MPCQLEMENNVISKFLTTVNMPNEGGCLTQFVPRLFTPTAPPDYSSVVTDAEAVQNNTSTSAPCSRPEDELSGILERPLMAYVHEFRFRPPPVYSEVRLPCQTWHQ